MRNRIIILFIACVFVSVGLPKRGSALPIGAELIEQNGLTWLSPIWSQNISYLDMINRLSNPSSVYYGLRVATTYEVLDLFNSLPLVHPAFDEPFSIGVQIDDDRIFGPAYGMMDHFFNQFGWHEYSVYPNYSRILSGYNWDPVKERIMITFVSEHDIYGGQFGSDSYELYFSTDDLSRSSERPYDGNWLVAPSESPPVPEPATIVLFATGLIGLAGGRPRRN